MVQIQPSTLDISSTQKGLASEARVKYELTLRGYTVLEPYGDNERYDLAIDHEDGLERVQVKTGNLKDSFIQFRLTSNRSTAKGVEHKPYTEDEIDSYIVVSYELDKLYYVPIEDTAKSTMRLRLSSKQDQPQINWAEDYEFSERFK